MNAALIFNVPDQSTMAAQRCRQAIAQLGAPLKSDSGHYITGVVTSGHNNVELRVTWLDDRGGTQITVSANHDLLGESELENVTQRFKYEYLNKTSSTQKRSSRFSANSILVLAGAVAVIAVFVFILLKH